MNILVTGSEGTLGKPLVKKLREGGYNVTECDIASMIRTDITNYRQLRKLFELHKIERCYHLAAEFGRVNGEHNYERLYETNILGTRNILELCSEFDVELIFASSSEVYGEQPEGIILAETLTPAAYYHCDYAMTKVFNEWQIQRFIIQRSLKAMILRFCNIYGPGERDSVYRSVVSRFIYSLLKGEPVTCFGDCSRSFLYIDDWVDIVGSNKFFNRETINIGGIQSISIGYLLELILKILDQHKRNLVRYVSVENDNVVHKPISIEKMLKMYDIEPRITIEEGLERTCKYAIQEQQTA